MLGDFQWDSHFACTSKSKQIQWMKLTQVDSTRHLPRPLASFHLPPATWLCKCALALTVFSSLTGLRAGFACVRTQRGLLQNRPIWDSLDRTSMSLSRIESYAQSGHCTSSSGASTWQPGHSEISTQLLREGEAAAAQATLAGRLSRQEIREFAPEEAHAEIGRSLWRWSTAAVWGLSRTFTGLQWSIATINGGAVEQWIATSVAAWLRAHASLGASRIEGDCELHWWLPLQSGRGGWTHHSRQNTTL